MNKKLNNVIRCGSYVLTNATDSELNNFFFEEGDQIEEVVFKTFSSANAIRQAIEAEHKNQCIYMRFSEDLFLVKGLSKMQKI